MRAAVDWAGTRREHDEGDGLEARREGRLAQMRRSKCRSTILFVLEVREGNERAEGSDRSARSRRAARHAVPGTAANTGFGVPFF